MSLPVPMRDSSSASIAKLRASKETLEEHPFTAGEKNKLMDAMSYDHSSPEEALAYILEQEEQSKGFPVPGVRLVLISFIYALYLKYSFSFTERPDFLQRMSDVALQSSITSKSSTISISHLSTHREATPFTSVAQDVNHRNA